MKKIKRGCGERVAGGAYICCDLSPVGIPIDLFLFDPPTIPVDEEGNVYYPGKVGLHFTPSEKEGVYHLLDWIGTNYYPTFPDFWEETRRLGLSRRISLNNDFSLLSQGSYIIGFHAFGILEGSKRVYKRLFEDEFVEGTGLDQCPHGLKERHFCPSYLWQLVDRQKDNESRLHDVPLPRSDNTLGTYKAAKTPSWINKYPSVSWIPAAMYAIPIQRIEVIEDSIEGKHEETLKVIHEGIVNLPVVLVKQ